MRKITTLMLIITVFLFSFSLAESTRFGYAPMLATNYVKWADEFRVADISMDYYYSSDTDENNEKTLFVDDIAIVYDNSTLYANYAALFYMSKNSDALAMVDQWKRASSFYCCLQYGDPLQSGVDIAKAKQEADSFITDLNNTMRDSYDDLRNGRPILFFTGKNADFYISYIIDEGQWMIFAQ